MDFSTLVNWIAVAGALLLGLGLGIGWTLGVWLASALITGLQNLGRRPAPAPATE